MFHSRKISPFQQSLLASVIAAGIFFTEDSVPWWLVGARNLPYIESLLPLLVAVAVFGAYHLGRRSARALSMSASVCSENTDERHLVEGGDPHDSRSEEGEPAPILSLVPVVHSLAESTDFEIGGESRKFKGGRVEGECVVENVAEAGAEPLVIARLQQADPSSEKGEDDELGHVTVLMTFEARFWQAVEVLGKGTVVRVVGKIEKFDRRSIWLVACEILKIGN